jgi:hypothetical protein
MIIVPNQALGDVAAFCMEKLGIIECDVDIHITECCLKDDNALGWCYDMLDGAIDIELEESLDDPTKILTLCHEMVHVRQAYRGDEKFCEREANKLEKELYDEFTQK